MSKYGDWISVTIASGGTSSDQINLGGDYYAVQVYNPAIDSATITVKPTYETGGTVVQAYNISGGSDAVNTTTARATAGMNLFNEICAQYIKIVVGAAQTSGAVTFKVRGIFPLQ